MGMINFGKDETAKSRLNFISNLSHNNDEMAIMSTMSCWCNAAGMAKMEYMQAMMIQQGDPLCHIERFTNMV